MATVIPVIDLNCSFREESEEAKKLLDACREWGCFRVVNHGVPEEILLKMRAVMHAVFELPDGVKCRKRSLLAIGQGYEPAGKANPLNESFGVLFDTRRPKAFGDFFSPLEVTLQQREIMDSYADQVNRLSMDLAMKITRSLGLKVEESQCDGWAVHVHNNKYAFTEKTIGELGVEAHTDGSFLTVLQDDYSVGGLQIERNNGEFIAVDPLPGALFVNIGDIGRAWSNGRFRSLKQKVVCSDVGTRITIAWSLVGSQQKLIEAPSALIDPSNPPLYRPFSLIEYGMLKFMTIKSGQGDVALERFSLKL